VSTHAQNIRFAKGLIRYYDRIDIVQNLLEIGIEKQKQII
jgi:hypothetical protein